jgi:catechol 2,3-dioxygenase-like lactoylglutathione lyase family enzyme
VLLDLTTLVVRDYDEAIAFFVDAVGFELAEDTARGEGKRWVVVRPPGGGSGLLLAQAVGEAQQAIVGGQTAGRVGFFLRVEEFGPQHARMVEHGVEFLEEPRHEEYGTVAVWRDVAGNTWDLLGG